MRAGRQACTRQFRHNWESESPDVHEIRCGRATKLWALDTHSLRHGRRKMRQPRIRQHATRKGGSKGESGKDCGGSCCAGRSNACVGAQARRLRVLRLLPPPLQWVHLAGRNTSACGSKSVSGPRGEIVWGMLSLRACRNRARIGQHSHGNRTRTRIFARN